MNGVEPIVVEFLGIPRHRAGRAELAVRAATVGAALTAVQQGCPGLANLLTSQGALAPHYLVSLNGERFLHDPAETLLPGSRLVLLSADAGG